MSVAYPATLPRPTYEGYSIDPLDPVLGTEMDGGNTRFRRRATAYPSRIGVRWWFTMDEFAVFEAWHKHTLNDGAYWFDVDLANGLGVQTWSAHFVGMWRAASDSGISQTVTATLLVRSRPLLIAEELEVASTWTPDDLAATDSLLHTLLHITLPGSYWSLS